MSRAGSGSDPIRGGCIPVLVLDGSWTHALRTVRALGRARTWDIHLIAGGKRAMCPARSSRHVKSFCTPKADEGSDACKICRHHRCKPGIRLERDETWLQEFADRDGHHPVAINIPNLQ